MTYAPSAPLGWQDRIDHYVRQTGFLRSLFVNGAGRGVKTGIMGNDYGSRSAYSGRRAIDTPCGVEHSISVEVRTSPGGHGQRCGARRKETAPAGIGAGSMPSSRNAFHGQESNCALLFRPVSGRAPQRIDARSLQGRSRCRRAAAAQEPCSAREPAMAADIRHVWRPMHGLRRNLPTRGLRPSPCQRARGVRRNHSISRRSHGAPGGVQKASSGNHSAVCQLPSHPTRGGQR